MSRYLHTADSKRDRDTDGVELANSQAARCDAIRYLGAVMRDEPDVLRNGRDFRLEVVGEDQRLVCTVITLAVDAPEPVGAAPD